MPGGPRVGIGAGGRPKKGEKPFDIKAEAAARNETPLEYMLRVMNDQTVDPGRRDRLAVAAAPYIHAKPGEAGKKESRQEAAKVTAVGRFAPPPPPGFAVN